MTNLLEQISPQEIGELLRVARESVKLTQEDAAKEIGVARTTIVAIAQGQRRVRVNEMKNLAKAYKTSVNALLRREAVHVDLAPRFRKLIEGNDDTAAAEAAEAVAELGTAGVRM